MSTPHPAYKCNEQITDHEKVVYNMSLNKSHSQVAYLSPPSQPDYKRAIPENVLSIVGVSATRANKNAYNSFQNVHRWVHSGDSYTDMLPATFVFQSTSVTLYTTCGLSRWFSEEGLLVSYDTKGIVHTLPPSMLDTMKQVGNM